METRPSGYSRSVVPAWHPVLSRPLEAVIPPLDPEPAPVPPEPGPPPGPSPMPPPVPDPPMPVGHER